MFKKKETERLTSKESDQASSEDCNVVMGPENELKHKCDSSR